MSVIRYNGKNVKNPCRCRCGAIREGGGEVGHTAPNLAVGDSST